MGWVFPIVRHEQTSAPTLPTWRGVWEKEKLLDRAAGVAESSGWIQVSVKPKMLSVDCKEKAEMKHCWQLTDNSRDPHVTLVK